MSTSSTPSTTRGWQRQDLVPLSQRLLYLQAFRVGAAAISLVLAPGSAPLRWWALGLLAVGAGAIVALRLLERSGRWLFGITLLVDGLALAAFAVLVESAGGNVEPVRFLAVLHLVVVTLVASHRTGVKLAIWHSLLGLLTASAVDIGWLGDPIPLDLGSVGQRLAMLWLVALVTALASAVNQREILRRRFDLDALARMSAELEQSGHVHDVASILVDAVADTFDASRVLLVSMRDGDPLAIAGRAVAPAASAGEVTGVIAAVLRRRTTTLVRSLGTEDGWLAAQLPDARQLAVVPLITDDEVTDLLFVEQRNALRGRLERRVVTTIERFAGQGALALRSSRLRAELVALAQTDGLTGVANRSALDRSLNAEFARMRRTGGSLVVMMCDVDHFKKVNDEHGHQIGDSVLIGVAQTLVEACREYDLIARYGGEEFCVLMPSTLPDVALPVAERLRRSVEEAGLEVPVTVSIGVAYAEGADHDPAALLGAADEALYQAKRGGRNRVVAAASAQAYLRGTSSTGSPSISSSPVPDEVAP